MLHCNATVATKTPLSSLACFCNTQRSSALHYQHPQIRRCSHPRLVKTQAADEQTQQSQSSSLEPPGNGPELPDRRALLAGAAVLLGTGGVLATRSVKGAPTFASLEQGSVDLDIALANGKPTIIEFYAAWCGICRELLPVSAEVQSIHKKNINFVALNIDNTKWTDEMSQYRVRGVPHFIFLDAQGRQLAAAVGRVPQQVLEDNAKALEAGGKMPYAKSAGRTSTPDNVSGTALKQTMPRDHA